MSFNPLTWNATEMSAAGRNVLSYTAGGVTVLAAWGLFSQHDAAEITRDINSIWDGATQVAKGVAALAGILVPVYTALRAAHSASPPEQVKAVTSLPQAQVAEVVRALPDVDSRNKIISAVADMGEVRAIVGPESLARATDSDKVVSTASKVESLPLAVPRAA